MIDTNEYENLRLLFLDFIDLGEDEEVWQRYLEIYDDLLAEVERLRGGLIAIQRSLIWDGEDRAMDGEPITLEALVAQVEQVRSDITEMIE